MCVVYMVHPHMDVYKLMSKYIDTSLMVCVCANVYVGQRWEVIGVNVEGIGAVVKTTTK